MTSSRRFATLGCVFAAMTIVACSSTDTSSAVEPSRPRLGLDGLLGGLDTAYTGFAIDPQATATYVIGGTHRLSVQVGGLCVLGSTYGIGTWDDACVLAELPVFVLAKSWTDSRSHPHIEFWPALRFAPLGDGRASAELYLHDTAASLDPHAVVLHCTLDGCVDEARTDSTLVTMRDWHAGYVYRRIKHFSGYQVSTGRDGDSTSARSRAAP